MITDYVFYLAAIPAVLVLGLSKGGFSGLGMIALPIMALVVPPLQGAAIILPILMAQDVVSLYAFRKTWSRDVILRFMPGALAGLCIGALLAAYVSDAMVELLVGLLACGFCIVHWTKREAADAAPRQPTRAKGAALGALSGFASFIANTGGVPFQAYAVPLRMPPALYAGTSTALFFVLNWIKFLMFIALGQVSSDNLSTSAALLPVAVAATFFGVWLVRRVPAKRFYAIVTALTFILGVKLIYDGARGLGAF
jgi:uncharacterized membrane protein YfcA